jgi:hypothetical protein
MCRRILTVYGQQTVTEGGLGNRHGQQPQRPLGFDEVQARLDRIEQARTPLKAIGTALSA